MSAPVYREKATDLEPSDEELERQRARSRRWRDARYTILGMSIGLAISVLVWSPIWLPVLFRWPR